MGMTIHLHAKTQSNFKARAYLASHDYSKNYPVVTIKSRGEEWSSEDEINIYPSYEQVKQIHKALSQLMKEIAAVEKAKKTAERLEAIVLPVENEDNDLPF